MGAIINVLTRHKKNRDPVEFWRKQGCIIGQGCEIYPSAYLGSEPYLISIGNYVRINSGVQLITHDGGCWVLRHLKQELADVDLFGRITIGDNVHIGTNALIMPGVTIGNNCIIGVGAIVTKDIPDNSIAVGIPARVIESVFDYEMKHIDDFHHTKNFTPTKKRDYLMSKFNNIAET